MRTAHAAASFAEATAGHENALTEIIGGKPLADDGFAARAQLESHRDLVDNAVVANAALQVSLGRALDDDLIHFSTLRQIGEDILQRPIMKLPPTSFF